MKKTTNNRLTFKEEKWIMQWYHQFGYIHHHRGIDSEIHGIVENLNILPYIYTNDWSCSKTPDDHKERYKQRGIKQIWDWLEKRGNKYIPPYSGYIHFRANPKDKRSKKLLDELSNLDNVSIAKCRIIIPTKESDERGRYPTPIEYAKATAKYSLVTGYPGGKGAITVGSKYLLTTVPKRIWIKKDLDLYQSFLEEKYEEINQVLEKRLERYSQEEKGELILAFFKGLSEEEKQESMRQVQGY